MSISFEDILIVVFLLGAIQGFILTFLLFTTKNNSIANRLLGLLTFFLALILCTFTLSLKGLMSYYPHFLRTISNVEFTFFPLLYLSVKYLLTKQGKFNKTDLLHFIPLLLNILLFSRFYFESAEDKYLMIQDNSGYYYYINIISDELLALQGIVYSILTLLLLKKYNSSVLNYKSSNNKALLRYVRGGVIIMLISWTIGTIAVNLNIFNVQIIVDLFLFTYLLLVIVIYVISYSAIKSDEIFKLSDEQISNSFITSNGILVDDLSLKNEGDKWSTEVIELNVQLLDYVDKEKPFLNPELGLQDIADGLGVSRHQVSAVINQVHGVNFYEFINKLRVEEVKKNLTDPEKKHFKIISLAYDAGFNSKASFNRIFKQYTDQTPSQYIATIQKV